MNDAVRADDEHALARELRGRRTAATPRGAGRPRSCPVPGPPCTTSAPSTCCVISSYCSGVIVEMIWRISPTRWRVMSSTIASVRWSSLARRQLLVDEPEHRAVLDVEPAPARDAARVGGRRRVERLGGGSAPVDRQQLVVARRRPRGGRCRAARRRRGRSGRSTAARSRSVYARSRSSRICSSTSSVKSSPWRSRRLTDSASSSAS